jgi:xanthine dehydrogenase YagT iron-sulfur-binding subunit
MSSIACEQRWRILAAAEELMGKDHKEDDACRCKHQGVSRRGFIASVGTGAIAAAATAGLAGASPKTVQAETIEHGQTAKVTLLINGRQRSMLVEPRWSLLYVLRERLGLTGTKVGCERGECGACTVLIDGQPHYACMMLALEVEGREINTVEGLMRGEDLGPVQRAFVEHDGFQCGYCTPGQVVAAEGLLRARPNPSEEEIRQGMSGNICRCGAYPHIVKSVRRAAELKAQVS